MESTRIPLDRLTWARWRRVVLDVTRSEIGGRVKLLLGALLALLMAINGLNVVNSYVGRDFMTAIEQRNMSGFLTLAALYIGVFAVSTVTAVIYRFTEERLGLLWRHWMTRSLVDYYLHDAAYYRLREHAEIPNLDVTFASESALADHHDASIALAADGSWSFEPAPPGRWMTWHRVTLVAAAAVLGTIGCSVAARWLAPETPSRPDAGILLSEESTAALSHRLRPTGIPDIPLRTHLRPCCVFGYKLRARLAFLPILGYRLENLKSIDEIGPHHYDSGVVTVGSDGDLVSDERNGLVFTCRGGFIDTAHVRDYADWTIYLASRLFEQLPYGTTIELPNEAGKRRVVLERLDPEFLRRHDPVSLTMAISQWLAFQLSIWHEIATWYGWSEVPGYPEKVSAFSPEDLYSNVLGTKIAVATAFEGGARSETLYDRSVDAWLRAVVHFLGPASKETAMEAMRSLEGAWWNPNAPLPDPGLVLRRNLSTGETVTPWLVPEALASEALEAALLRECGALPTPLSLPNPSTFEGTPLRTLARLELRVDPAIASQPPFDALGPSVTQDDFLVIVAAIREQNRHEFGPRANQPD